jgi:hypothetical protein
MTTEIGHSPLSYLDSSGQPEEASAALQGVPWVAVALAVHVMLLVVAWFILPPRPIVATNEVIGVTNQLVAPPPAPVQKPEDQSILPDDRITPNDPTPDKRVEEATDDSAEDPTDKPNRDLAENPNDNPSPDISPYPDKTNRNTSIGLKGGLTGGGGPSGSGGLEKLRPRGPGGLPPDKPSEFALSWLAAHQNPKGYWSATTFNQDSTRADATRTYNIEFVSPGDPAGDKGWEMSVDIGLTGLALLAFTTAGCDHRDPDYGRFIRRSIMWLRQVQEPDGCFGPKSDDHFVYNHAICTMALAEIYGLSSQDFLKPIVERAVDFILHAQNPGAGWRYDVAGGGNDSSVTGWMVLALHTCEYVGITFDKSKVYDGAASWYDIATVDVNGYPRCGYDTPGSNCSRLRSAAEVYDDMPSMDAIYIMSMLFMRKAEVNDARIKSMARACIEKDNLPQWKQNKLDMYYWYYASLALFQVGGAPWQQWNAQVQKVLVDHQRGFHPEDAARGLTSAEVLDEYGSWDAVDAWSACGGRVYSTAMGVLILESIKRHERLQKK